jgi:hypothetical protein
MLRVPLLIASLATAVLLVQAGCSSSDDVLPPLPAAGAGGTGSSTAGAGGTGNSKAGAGGTGESAGSAEAGAAGSSSTASEAGQGGSLN